MLKSLYWRINFFFKNRKSIKARKKLGKDVKAIIVTTKNGIFAVDPGDLEVGDKLRNQGSYGLDEIERVSELITEDSNILIVGAHIGSLAIPISKKCANLVAIEANPQNYELLKINIINRLIIIKLNLILFIVILNLDYMKSQKA